MSNTLKIFIVPFLFLLIFSQFPCAGASWSIKSTGLPTSGTYFGVTYADVDNDDDLDIIGASDGDGLRVFLGDGNGAWEAVPLHPATSGGFSDVCAGDFNDDGNLDIFAGSPGNDASTPKGIQVFRGDGSGGFVDVTALSSLPSTGNWRGVAVGDVNEDNHLDIAATSGWGSSNGIHVYTGDGTGRFTDDSSGLPGDQDRDSGVVLVDFNDDGNLDLAAGGAAGVSVYLGNGGNGGSMQWTEASSGLPDARFTGVDAADVDKDGSIDLVLSSYRAGSGHGLRVYKNVNDASSWTSISTGLPTSGDYLDVSAGDIDNDGDFDIVTAGSYGSTYGIHVFYGDGQGSWSEDSEGLPTTNQYVGNALGDVNGDGRPDMLFGRYRGGGLEVWSYEVGTISLSLDKNSVSVNETVTEDLTLTVQNNGNGDVTVTFSTSGDLGLSALNSASLNVPAGQSRSHQLTVTDEGKSDGTHTVTITASVSGGQSTSSKTLTVLVGNEGDGGNGGDGDMDEDDDDDGTSAMSLGFIVGIIVLIIIIALVLLLIKRK